MQVAVKQLLLSLFSSVTSLGGTGQGESRDRHDNNCGGRSEQNL
jgi:hypothetical protein